MINKTVIRKEKKTNEFTTIHNSILLDTRLSPIAFKLLVSILSDSDNFTLSQTLYMKRLGISQNRTYLNAIKNLEQCCYLRKKLINEDVYIPKIKKANSKKKVYHYTISEYGNLKPEVQIEPEPIAEELKLDEMKLKQEKCFEFIKANSRFFEENDFIQNKTIDSLNNDIIEIEYYQNLIEEEKETKIYLKQVYEEKLDWIQNIIRPNQEKSVKEFKEWLKNEVFNKRNTEMDYNSVRSTYSHISLIKNKKKIKTDYETEMGDYYENPRD